MGYGTNGLTFNTLREANKARLPQFKNSKGEPAHSKPDGSDWTPSQWLQAVVGELGEFANIRKKFERGDLSFEEYEIEAKKELADVQTYLDILALRALDDDCGAVHPTGIDLGKATIEKFNAVSERVKAEVKIHADGSDWFKTENFPSNAFMFGDAVTVAGPQGRPHLGKEGLIVGGPDSDGEYDVRFPDGGFCYRKASDLQ